MKIIASMLITLALTVQVGCSTIEGIGKDIKKGGQVLESAAKK